MPSIVKGLWTEPLPLPEECLHDLDLETMIGNIGEVPLEYNTP
jgi:hypothetical protein